MMHDILLFLSPLLCIISGCGCQSIFVTYPHNTALVVGNRILFECSISNAAESVMWFKEATTMFNGRSILPAWTRHTVRPSNGSFDLVIEPVELSDAGMYWCMYDNNNKAGAELIVLESDPACKRNTSVEMIKASQNAMVLLQCSVTYNGSWAPDVTWEQLDATGESTYSSALSSDLRTVGIRDQAKTLESLIVISTTTNLTISQIRFTLFFNTSKRNATSGSTAATVPDYNFTWTQSVYSTPSLTPTHSFPITITAIVVIVCITVVILASVAIVILMREYECECIVKDTPDLIASNTASANRVIEVVDYAEVSVRNFSIGHPESERSVITLEIPDRCTSSEAMHGGPQYAEMRSIMSHPSPLQPRRRNEQAQVYAAIDHRPAC